MDTAVQNAHSFHMLVIQCRPHLAVLINFSVTVVCVTVLQDVRSVLTVIQEENLFSQVSTVKSVAVCVVEVENFIESVTFLPV